MDESDITDWPSCKLGKKFSNLERNFRCLICRDMYENPQMLNCGHSYCSLCIRQHLDHALNSNNSNRCPDVSHTIVLISSHSLPPNKTVLSVSVEVQGEKRSLPLETKSQSRLSNTGI